MFSKPGFWLLLIIASALLVRLYHITYPINDMHDFRQTQTAGLIRDYYRHGINLLYPTIITLGKPGYLVLEFPIYQAISAVLYKIFTPDVIVARFFTILIGLLSIYFVYRISSRFLDQKSSLLAAFFFAFMPLDIFFQRVPMQDPLTILVSLIMLDCLIEGIRGKKIYLVFGMLAASLGLVMKSPFAGPLFLPSVYLIWRERKKSKASDYMAYLATFIVPLTVMVIWQRHANFVNNTYCNKSGYPFRDLYASFVVKLHPFNTVYFGTIAERLALKNYLIITRRIFWKALTPAGFFFFVAGVFSLALRKKAGFLFVWLFSLCIIVWTVFNMYIVHNYWLLPLCPVLSIFCGAGAGSLLDGLKKYGKWITTAFVVIIAAAVFSTGFSTAKKLFRGTSLIVIGEFIGQHTEKGSLVAIASPDVDLFNPVLMYFADRHGFTIPLNRMNNAMVEYMRLQGVKYLAEIEPSGFVVTTRIFDISGNKPVPVAYSVGQMRPN
ncbi:MAG: glycosyltransferase family 39 protein [Nitrospiraceae bacterium]|nr:glycosyltransferase family 39 protein [Nitrospiraceae bacterium]